MIHNENRQNYQGETTNLLEQIILFLQTLLRINRIYRN